METREDLTAADRRRFRTGRPCLDFTHTGGEGAFARWELLHGPDDAARYLGIVLGAEPPAVREVHMPGIRALRSAITVIARTLAVDPDRAYGQREIDRLNDAASHPDLPMRLGVDHTSSLVAGTARQACSALARDAIDLFASPLRGRVRICEAADCGLLFVDASRPGRRRWCSMDWCGDRQKKRRAGRTVR